MKKTYSTNDGEFSKDNLLPCPFCGSDPHIEFIGNNHTIERRIVIKCQRCRIGFENAAKRHDTEWLLDASIKHYNKRFNR